MQDVETIAAGLTKAQRRALSCPPCWGLPAGHNQWFDLAYFRADDDEQEICNGEDMDALIRLNLAVVGDRDDEGGEHLTDEDRDVEARWKIDLTPFGLAVRAHLLSATTTDEGEGG